MGIQLNIFNFSVRVRTYDTHPTDCTVKPMLHLKLLIFK